MLPASSGNVAVIADCSLLPLSGRVHLEGPSCPRRAASKAHGSRSSMIAAYPEAGHKCTVSVGQHVTLAALSEHEMHELRRAFVCAQSNTFSFSPPMGSSAATTPRSPPLTGTAITFGPGAVCPPSHWRRMCHLKVPINLQGSTCWPLALTRLCTAALSLLPRREISQHLTIATS